MGIIQTLAAYRISYELAIEIFRITKKFPESERYSLVDQIRRSSRSVCSNLAEAYSRRYSRNYFINKLNDCTAENAETQVWLDFSRDFLYIDIEIHEDLSNKNTEVGKLLRYMIANPEKFS